MPKAVIDLNGIWQFKEYPAAARRMRDLDEGNWFETKVPSSIFTGLIESGCLKRAEIEQNPENFAWISQKPWVFRKTFEVSEEFKDFDRIDLVCEGLDTAASIWLNEKLAARTDNMFVSHRFDVTKYVQLGTNQLLIKFECAEKTAENLMSRYGNLNESDLSNPCRAYLRKAQYQFGWDWCPAMPGCGIFRPVRLEGICKAAIKNVHFRTIQCDENHADITMAAEIDAVSNGNYDILLDVTDCKGNLVHQENIKPHNNSLRIVFGIDKPNLWFPAGYGKANLYQAQIKLFCEGRQIDEMQNSFGIRTVRLDNSSDGVGEKFQFEINGLQVYAKGSNWIPATIFPGSLRDSDYEKLLSAASNANMNMLRVWGGGYYEDDVFYNLCDRLGIMVWQDFMFANAYYPDRQWFLDKVNHEARYVIERLRSHPCLVLWCGNNEINQMHHKARGKKFYGQAIYNKILPEMVCELDPDRPYIPTTPFSPSKKLDDPASGTVHNWDVWSGHQPISSYISSGAKVPRFVTEFGFQSLPDKETVIEFCPQEKLRIGSYALEKHNYQINGSSRIYRYMGDLFGAANSIERFIYLSQLTQARAVKTYVEFLRANSQINSGALFWQMNDCCPAISWSAIDYLNRPKALYYYAKRFFAPVLITALPEFEKSFMPELPCLKSLNAVVVNDTCETFFSQLSCRLMGLDGELIDQVQLPICVSPFSVSNPLKIPGNIVRCGNPEKSVLHFIAEKDGAVIAENLFLFLPDKYIEWPSVNIQTGFVKTGEYTGCLTIRSDKVAKDVKIEIENCKKLDNNYIDLLPNRKYEIRAEFDQPINILNPPSRLISVSHAISV
ncbi:MAG: sugar-binding domain-containing protein [Phycisphaerae bacterium]